VAMAVAPRMKADAVYPPRPAQQLLLGAEGKKQAPTESRKNAQTSLAGVEPCRNRSPGGW
jgi:hypothetical protein